MVSLGRGEVERRVEAAEGGAAREPRILRQKPARLRHVAVPGRRRQPLAEASAAQGVAHMYIRIYGELGTVGSRPASTQLLPEAVVLAATEEADLLLHSLVGAVWQPLTSQAWDEEPGRWQKPPISVERHNALWLVLYTDPLQPWTNGGHA